MNVYTLVSKEVRMVIVIGSFFLKHKGFKVDYASNKKEFDVHYIRLDFKNYFHFVRLKNVKK